MKSTYEEVNTAITKEWQDSFSDINGVRLYPDIAAQNQYQTRLDMILKEHGWTRQDYMIELESNIGVFACSPEILEAVGTPIFVSIILNGEKQMALNDTMSYEELLQLAGYDPERTLTVVVKDKNREGKILLPGQCTIISEGTIVAIADTSYA